MEKVKKVMTKGKKGMEAGSGGWVVVLDWPLEHEGPQL